MKQILYMTKQKANKFGKLSDGWLVTVCIPHEHAIQYYNIFQNMQDDI